MGTKHRTKVCNHCGEVTEPQPQDWDRDLGYGYCKGCLSQYWPIAGQLDFENISFDLRLNESYGTCLLDKFQNGEFISRQTCHMGYLELRNNLINKYLKNSSSTIPTNQTE